MATIQNYFIFAIFALQTDCSSTQNGSHKSCSIDINGFQYFVKQSLPVDPNSHEFVHPTKEGIIELDKVGSSIEFDCPSGFQTKGLTSQKSVIATCNPDHILQLRNNPNVKVSFENLQCKKEPKATARETQNKCGSLNDGVEVEFGFEINENWIRMITVCFDKQSLRTHWVHHHMSESNLDFQRKVKRPHYAGVKFYKKFFIDVTKKILERVYGRNDQLKTLLPILGDDAMSLIKPNKGFYFERGHLSRVKDYPFGSQQRTMTNYLLVAQQWKTINHGNFYRLEIELVHFIEELHAEVEVYSGVHGVLRRNNISICGYYYPNSNNSKHCKFPVPEYYYKVLIDHGSTKDNRGQSAIALICINDPHATLKDIETVYNLCTDVSDEVNFNFWKNKENGIWKDDRENRKSIIDGYSFACKLDSFLKNVTELPKEVREAHSYPLMRLENRRR